MVLARLPVVVVCGAHSRRLCSVASVGHRLAQRRARQPIRIVYAHEAHTARQRRIGYLFLQRLPLTKLAPGWSHSHQQ